MKLATTSVAITLSDLAAGEILALVRKEAARCQQYANYWQAKSNPERFDYWLNKKAKWTSIENEIEKAALAA